MHSDIETKTIHQLSLDAVRASLPCLFQHSLNAVICVSCQNYPSPSLGQTHLKLAGSPVLLLVEAVVELGVFICD